jgi:hypothetical protein
VLFQGVNESNSNSYLSILQREKSAKEQDKMYQLFLYRALTKNNHYCWYLTANGNKVFTIFVQPKINQLLWKIKKSRQNKSC